MCRLFSLPLLWRYFHAPELAPIWLSQEVKRSAIRKLEALLPRRCGRNIKTRLTIRRRGRAEAVNRSGTWTDRRAVSR
jgi:hypothetical protein